MKNLREYFATAFSRRVVRTFGAFLAGAIILAGMVGCAEESAGKRDSEPVQSLGDTTNAGEAITIAIHPYESALALAEQFGPLVTFLEERTGKQFSLLVSANYENHISLAGNNEVDMAFMGPAPYVSMVAKFGKKRLLCSVEANGSPYYQGYIIVREDNPAITISDLQGKSFGASSRVSTMSYTVPRYMFIKAGIPFPEAQLRILESHNNVCLNVLAGDVNAGAVREKTYEKYKDREIRVIAVTPEVRGHLFLATDKLDQETFEMIREALLSIKSKDDVERLLAPIKFSITGLLPVVDEDYDVLRTIMAAVHKDEERTHAQEGSLK